MTDDSTDRIPAETRPREKDGEEEGEREKEEANARRETKSGEGRKKKGRKPKKWRESWKRRRKSEYGMRNNVCHHLPSKKMV